MFDLVGKAANNHFLPRIDCPHSQSMFQILPQAKSLSLLFSIPSRSKNLANRSIFRAMRKSPPLLPAFRMQINLFAAILKLRIRRGRRINLSNSLIRHSSNAPIRLLQWLQPPSSNA